LRMRFGANEPELAKKTRDMMLLVDRAIEGVRDVAARLRPAVLDMGVITAIEWLCSQFTLLTAVSCNLQVPEESIELDEAHKLTVFRIVQESLTNVTRHARASNVEITIGRDDADLWLEVRDDGIGFDSTATSTGKTFGLLSMRERAIALGGTVHIVSSSGFGTTVSVRIPLNT
jgi:signal transduction histidine kinase